MTPEGLTALADVEIPSNPFPGLRPFEFGESHLYFGRDGQSDQLIRKLAATRFVAVVGTSGSGKSSLVRAGLLPDLFSGFMSSAGSHWRVALMRPGNDPLGNLASALCSTEVFGSEIEENARIQEAVTEATLRRGGLGLIEAVRQNRMPQNESLLVVVDQFEELFRFARVAASEQYRYEAAAFVKLLLEAARQREQNIYVVLTMRSDFLGDCSIFWDLPEAINEGQFLIPRMTRDQRAEAITGPVAVCGGRIEQRLVNRLLNDMGDNPDLLPILQHALMRTWENWVADHAEGEAVDLRHYEAVGTMSDALSRHADEAFNELPNERARQIAEQVFRALTEKGDDNREVRRPTVLKDLCAQVGATPAEVVPVLDIFRREGRSFLMPPSSVPLDEESLIDISHESLIRNWARLKEWVEEESGCAQIYRRLAETAVLHERGEAGLWRDPDLQLGLGWREKHGPHPAWAMRYHPAFDSAMKFLDASVQARDAAALEDERRRRREIRRTRIAAVIFFLLFMLSLAALTYARVQRNEAQEKSDAAVAALSRVEQANARAEAALADAVRERDRANQQTDIAKRNEEIANGATDDALKEKKAAEQAKADAVKSAEVARLNALRAEESRAEAERQTLEAEKQKGKAEAETAKSRQLLYASDMTLAQRAYDAGSITLGRQLLTRHFIRGGGLGFEWRYLHNLLQGEKDSQGVGPLRPVTLLDGVTKPVIEFGQLHSFSLSGDGGTLAVNEGSEIELRDATGRKLLRTIPTVKEGKSAGVPAMAISHDGKRLAFSNIETNEVKVVNVETGEASTLGPHKSEVLSVAFSPDGGTLAVGTALSDDDHRSEVAFWDVASGERRGSFRSLDSVVVSLAFSPDGKTVAAGAVNGILVQLDGASAESKCLTPAKNGGVTSVAFSPNSKWLAYTTHQGSVWLKPVGPCGARTNPSPNYAMNAPGEVEATSVAFSRDGGLLAASFADNTIKVWHASFLDTRPRATFKGHGDLVNSVAFLRDGTLVTGGEDNFIKVWDAEALALEQTPLTGHKSAVNALAFSPDGTRLFSGGNDKTVLVWDVATRQKAAPDLAYKGEVHALAVSPDGRLLVTGALEPALTLRDAKTFEVLADFQYQLAEVTSAAFSPDGKRFVTCAGSAVRLWDVDTKQIVGEQRLDHPYRVAFSPDGKTVAASSTRSEVKLWDAALKKELASHSYSFKNDAVVGVYSLAFSPDSRTLAAALDNGAAILLDAATLEEREALRGHKGAVYSLAFSPDGQTLATGGADGVVKLWATVSGKELIALRGHEDAVMVLAFSPDGQTLASGGQDRKVMLWSAPLKSKAAAHSP
ncbi:MAG TPA: hypothetical protein VGP08_07825 [Pyrinomonadaceae bacterium]|jgi:WD40 repeat protein|nr:hypothetical protein [Pyrinomonadaceae bacterium]